MSLCTSHVSEASCVPYVSLCTSHVSKAMAIMCTVIVNVMYNSMVYPCNSHVMYNTPVIVMLCITPL